MFSYPCKRWHALVAEMHSAIIEAKAIVHDARPLSRASNRSSEKWWQITERWENARRRRILASAELKIHLTTHRTTPTSAIQSH